jgi:phosphatidyl-myo-inositol dimannoside synthase
MKVLVLLHDSYGAIGGIAKFNRDLLTALDRDQRVKEVVVLPRLDPEGEEPLPGKLTVRARPPGGKPGYLAAAIGEWRHAGVDLVIAGHLRLLIPALAAAGTHRPLWLIAHGIDAWQPSLPVLDPLLIRRVDRVIAVSGFTQTRLCGWARLPCQRFRLLPNCIDPGQLTPGPRDGELLQRYGLAGRTVLMTLARLADRERYKGVDETLEALPRLIGAYPNLAYLVVGDGPDRARLAKKSAALGIADRVVFAGRIAERDKARHYRLADVFVMPGRCEGFGIVYLEALACGIPVVGSKLDGSRDALLEGALGELVDPRDPDDLMAGIGRALARPKGVPQGLATFHRSRFEERVSRLLDDLATVG